MRGHTRIVELSGPGNVRISNLHSQVVAIVVGQVQGVNESLGESWRDGV
jgi:hypothetical protein